MFRNHVRTLLVGSLVALMAFTLGCRRLSNDALPDEATFFLESPQDEVDGTQSQAVCASDTAAYDELLERIQTYNEAIAARVALLKAVSRATRRELARDGEAEYTAERNGFTITLHAVEDEEANVTYDVSITDPDGNVVRVLEGTSNGPRSEGTWQIFNAQSEVVVEVDWTNVDGVLTVNRTATGAFGTRDSTYIRNEDTVSLVFVGPEHEASAQWDRETKDGSIIVDGVETCWDASDDLQDFCTVDCGG